jgi:hypothetical protein
MADDEDAEGPVVELGERRPVEGAPIARLTARLHYGIERSEVDRRLGDERIRTPEGPRRLGEVLEGMDETYFERRQDLERALRDAVGRGPVPAGDPEPEPEPEPEPDADVDEGADGESESEDEDDDTEE